ncbi:MAG TPA: phage Gp37/Gp68 family protein [Polyangiaceae bacterium]|nr:phage Gp37/Gp68 family protein [Polyangiaceae bacterium]
MAENSKIEWCDHTFNPWLGCSKISPACDHCYAESWAKRTGHPELWQGERRRTSAAYWKQPLKWDAQARFEGRRVRVFCASLADVFDNEVDPRWRAALWELIASTPNLDWLLLTKRVGNVKEMLPTLPPYCRPWNEKWPWPNVWLGATIANQEEADRDIPKLLATPAAVRFLSCEPLLGPVNLNRILLKPSDAPERGKPDVSISALRGWFGGAGDPARVEWVIAGGESGPKARPSHPDWLRSLSDQCVTAGVPFLFKQWGEWAPDCICGRDSPCRETPRPTPGKPGVMFRCGKKESGRSLNYKVWDQFPELQR